MLNLVLVMDIYFEYLRERILGYFGRDSGLMQCNCFEMALLIIVLYMEYIALI